MLSCDSDEDPFSEELLLSAICSLRNIAVPPKRKYQKRKKPEPKPKVYVSLDPRFLFSPPAHYKLLPEGDERWKVPHLFSDSYCSGDHELYKRVVGDLFDPQMDFFMQYDGKQNPYGPNTRHLKGLHSLIDFGLAFMASAPDFVSLLYEPPTVHYDEDTDDSFGCFKCVVSMTKINVIVTPEQLAADSSSSGAVNVEGNVLRTFNDFSLVRLPPTMPVIPSYQVTRYTYAMNPQHKITRLCLLFKHIFKDPLISADSKVSVTPPSSTDAAEKNKKKKTPSSKRKRK